MISPFRSGDSVLIKKLWVKPEGGSRSFTVEHVWESLVSLPDGGIEHASNLVPDTELTRMIFCGTVEE